MTGQQILPHPLAADGTSSRYTVSVICCCVTHHPKLEGLETTIHFCLIVNVGRTHWGWFISTPCGHSGSLEIPYAVISLARAGTSKMAPHPQGLSARGLYSSNLDYLYDNQIHEGNIPEGQAPMGKCLLSNEGE